MDDRRRGWKGLNSLAQQLTTLSRRLVDGLWTAPWEAAGTNPEEVPMTNSFAGDLRDGFGQMAAVLTARELDVLARARDSIIGTTAERNQILARIVCAYRAGPRQLWGPVLLDLLAPALIESLRGFRAEPPVVDEEEIRQQLVLEVLRAAQVMPIHDGGRQMKIRLVTRANRAVVRWLAREGVRQDWQRPLEVADERTER